MKENILDDEEEEINTSSNINNIIMEKKLNKNSYASPNNIKSTNFDDNSIFNNEIILAMKLF